MNKFLSCLAVIAYLIPVNASVVQSSQTSALGQASELTLSYDDATESRESSGNSHGSNTILETIVAVRDNGVELLYDLPEDKSSGSKVIDWRFPVRTFRPSDGPLQLLNRDELEDRAKANLRQLGLPRSACGQLYFTWTAGRIECDPEAALNAVKAFQFDFPGTTDLAVFNDADAIAPAPLTLATDGSGGTTYIAVLKVNPEAIRKKRAQVSVDVGKILGRQESFESAISASANDSIIGEITVTFNLDSTGRVFRRRSVTKITTIKPTGDKEFESNTTTLERRVLSTSNPADRGP